jgi:LysM repeat protein
MHNIISIIFILFVISGCVTQPPAPIEYNHNKISNSKPSRSSNEYSEKTVPIVNNSDEIVAKPLPTEKEENFDKPAGTLKTPGNEEEMVVLPQPKQDNSKVIYHEVQEGETIELIAENYDQTVEEITQLNDLSPPYDLKEFQIIKIKVSGELLNKKNKQQASNLLKDRNSANSSLEPNRHDKFIKPVDGKIITRFGDQTPNGKSNGISIESEIGNNIKSIASGTVVYSGNDTKFGNLVIVKLDYGDVYVAYAHMQDLILEKGIAIKQGELVGHVGDTGVVDGPGLYLAIKEGKIAVNPLKYIPM